MKVALGLKAHCGWAMLVVLGKQGDQLAVVDRRRIELVDHAWARQPYHAAEGLEPQKAHVLVQRGIDEAQRGALSEMKAAIKRERDRKNEVTGCSVLVGTTMPNWNTDEILAVHFRMHKAEGVLFQNVLLRAAEQCGLKTLAVLDKDLMAHAEDPFTKKIAALGKSIGPPWGKDQKDAALVALMLLDQRS